MTEAAYVDPDTHAEADRERDDLAAMLASPGWRLLCDHVAAEWRGDRVMERLRGIATVKDVNAQNESCAQILASMDAVDVVMGWAYKRVKALSAKPAPRVVAKHRRARV